MFIFLNYPVPLETLFVLFQIVAPMLYLTLRAHTCKGMALIVRGNFVHLKKKQKGLLGRGFQ